jgi:hypothetical protein
LHDRPAVVIGQVRPLAALRWRMVRTTRARRGFIALAAAVPVLCLIAGVVGATAPRGRNFDVLLLAPSAYLTVGLLTLVAPLIAGGGHELFPTDQLDAYPVTARTHYLASLLLTPLNLAWTVQLIALVGLTTFVSDTGPGVALAVLTCLVFLASLTLAGQALAWFVVGIRQRTWGRQLSWAVAAALAAATAATAVSGRISSVLDNAPTTWVVVGAVNGAAGGSPGAYRSWATVTGVLLAAAWIAYRLGMRSCTWSLRQPTHPSAATETRSLPRRGPASSALRAHLAVDRASVWRSSSLRRGLLVLGILPGAVSALAGLEWPSLVMLPGLVAAGAGLLFGVNAFCLDGTGAVWLASLPGDNRILFRAKAQVVAEVCTVAVVLAVLAGAPRAGRPPTAAELVALVGCGVVSVSRVVATCMRLSLLRPHHAELRGPRDTPAPPGAMAAYSVRLAVSTTLVAVLFSGVSQLDDWWLPAALVVPFLLFSARRLVGSTRLWMDPTVRAHVVATVANG